MWVYSVLVFQFSISLFFVCLCFDDRRRESKVGKFWFDFGFYLVFWCQVINFCYEVWVFNIFFSSKGYFFFLDLINIYGCSYQEMIFLLKLYGQFKEYFFNNMVEDYLLYYNVYCVDECMFFLKRGYFFLEK